MPTFTSTPREYKFICNGYVLTIDHVLNVSYTHDIENGLVLGIDKSTHDMGYDEIHDEMDSLLALQNYNFNIDPPIIQYSKYSLIGMATDGDVISLSVLGIE